MAQFSIRPARPEDCGTILELIRGIAEYEKMSDEVVATEETIRHAMFDEHVTRCLLAELDGKVIGYALYFYNYSTFIVQKASIWRIFSCIPNTVRPVTASGSSASCSRSPRRKTAAAWSGAV